MIIISPILILIEEYINITLKTREINFFSQVSLLLLNYIVKEDHFFDIVYLLNPVNLHLLIRLSSCTMST